MPPSREVQAQTPEQISATVEDFFAEWPSAIVLEDGKLLFDLRNARYSLANEYGRCTVHLWDDQRNLVRRIVSAHSRSGILRLSVQRFGHAKPTLLEIVTDHDRRSASTREQTRVRYVRILERCLAREFPAWSCEQFRVGLDMSKSLGAAYARGLLVRGTQAWAVLGVNADELSASIDAILTFGILWLHACREGNSRRSITGLKLVLPRGTATLTLSRLAWLKGERDSWELWELDQTGAYGEALTKRDIADQGNLASKLAQSPDEDRARERFAASTRQVLSLVPASKIGDIEKRFRSGHELAFLLHGLEFARVRIRSSAESFNRIEQITFGAGAHETLLTEGNKERLRELVLQLCNRRHAEGDKRDLLYRMQPERWLEGELRRDLALLDTKLQATHVYAQVPAFAGGDRGMLDLLSVSEDGRLAVIELKVDVDPQLALQGLDYWIRVRWHHIQNPDRTTGLGEFQQHGYFAGIRLSDAAPRLFLIAPALRVHPAVETVLHYLSPRVEWTLIGLDERWRKQINVIWRKRSVDS